MGLFGTSGIRELFDSSLVELALKVGLAVGRAYKEVVVGGDPRTSSEALKHAVISGLLAAGARADDAGMVPTPTLGFAARKFAAGVMITASHNPPQYNGIKLLSPDGAAFGAEERRQIEEVLSSDSLDAAPWDKVGQSGVYADATRQHLERILKDFPTKLKLKVALDCGGGAGSVVTPYLLRELGCEVVEINCRPSGFFPREIEPTEANLGDLLRATRESGADLGIAHDGDADRMMAVDDRGRFIPGDKLLIIFARMMGAKEVVTTLDASMAIEEVGFRVRRTRIGDSYVSEELKKGGDFGGEPSGSWIFPAISLCPDGIYAAAQLVAIASQEKLSRLVDDIPSYHLLRGSVAGPRAAVSSLESPLMELAPLSLTKADGLRLSFEDGWLLVRASGTEPKIRLTVEAKSWARAQKLYHSALKVVTGHLEGLKERAS
jgi:phosphoglucosamine mutase